MSFYDLLGVSPDASPSEIDTAFEKFAQGYNLGANPNQAQAAQSAKAVAEAYRVLRDPVRRKEYDSRLAWLQSPVKDPAISQEELQSWRTAGNVSGGLASKIKAERVRREKEERDKEGLELAKQRSFDNALSVVWRIVVVLLAIGGFWLLVTLIRYFWTHPLF